jgi:hypothetical protein
MPYLAASTASTQKRSDRLSARVARDTNGREITLSNGLLRRVFRLVPNGATVALDNLMTGASLLRGVKPEATLTIDGADIDVGGLVGQPDYAYLAPEWLDRMTSDQNAFRCTGIDNAPVKPRFP